MSERNIDLALIQSKCSEDPKENLERTLTRIREAAERGARIVCTQELFKSPYFCKTEDAHNFRLAEPIESADSPALVPFRELAKRKGVVIVASLFENVRDTLYFNTSVVIDSDGSYLGKYRKMHIPDDPRFLEKFYFTPGDLGFRCFDTSVGRIGVLICWDQWFPEAARITALRGAELILYPTAIGYLSEDVHKQGAYGEKQVWQTVQRGHAIANGCYVAAVNRVGYEAEAGGTEGIAFWGSSFVCAPNGEIQAEASDEDEEILISPVDFASVSQARRDWAYFFRDRRIDAYAGIDQRSLP